MPGIFQSLFSWRETAFLQIESYAWKVMSSNEKTEGLLRLTCKYYAEWAIQPSGIQQSGT